MPINGRPKLAIEPARSAREEHERALHVRFGIALSPEVGIRFSYIQRVPMNYSSFLMTELTRLGSKQWLARNPCYDLTATIVAVTDALRRSYTRNYNPVNHLSGNHITVEVTSRRYVAPFQNKPL